MSCHNCGSGQNLCRYSNASTARFFRKVTHAGLDPQCQPAEGETLYDAIPFLSAGKWKATLGDGTTVQVQSKCINGTWRATLPNAVNGFGGPFPLVCVQAPEDSVNQVLQNNCAGFHMVEITTFPGGGWLRLEIKITVQNNAECP
jgi:hypothetical protein